MKTTKRSILIVDDDPSILEVLDTRFSSAGFRVHKAEAAAKGLEVLTSHQIDMVISDIKMPNMSGLEMYSHIQDKFPGTPVIFLTAYGNIPEAVFAVQEGAIDYLAKPFSGKELLERVIDHLSGVSTSIKEKKELLHQSDYYWGDSSAMKTLMEMVARIASSNVNTLILGESGVGKECIAKTIHQNSERKNGPLIVVDCGSTPPGILESELFGHTKGSFTHAVSDKKGLIEAADGGTLFLDEIGNISQDMQHRLLRFLETKKIRKVGSVTEKSIDCRIIAATNADLEKDISEGTFRKDLYYRLRVVALHIPPLRQRKEDIVALTNIFIEQHRKAHGLGLITVDDHTMQWLQNHRWPGNIRELKNSLEAAVVLSADNKLSIDSFQLEQQQPDSDRPESIDDYSLDASEKEAIIRALQKSRGVLTAAAELLEISRRSIHYKLKKYHIEPSEYR